MNIYVLRHGETQHNKKGYYYGSMDVELSEEGKLQAKKAGDILDSISFDEIFISEKKRTLQTVEVAVKNRSDLIIDKRLNERNFGIFEGKSYEQLKAKYSEECKKWEEDWMNYTPEGGESHSQVCERVFDFMDYVLKLNHENILICAHAGIMRAIYCYLMEKDTSVFWKFACNNGDLALLKYEYGNLYLDSIIPCGRM